MTKQFYDCISWICSDCGKRVGTRLPICATFHVDVCDICKKETWCTEPRDFGVSCSQKRKLQKPYTSLELKK